jgi:hypothetical protein
MTLKDLHRLALLRQHEKYPNVPIHALYVKSFKDTTANELTRSIEAFIRMTGNYADRINNTGIYDKKTGRWRKGGTRKGIADIMAAKHIEVGGRKLAITVAIEVKVGKDRMSPDQVRVKAEIEKAGGVYIIARSWDQFYEEWNRII